MLRLLDECRSYLGPRGCKLGAHRVKERAGCVAVFDHELEDAMAREESCELPDGTIVEVGLERLRCPEALLRPNLVGLNVPGMHECIIDSIRNSPHEVQNELYGNIILSGGNTMFTGLPERLRKELDAGYLRVKVVAPPERKSSVFIGGSILASLAMMQPCWISTAQYNEAGPGVVHRKCF
eukprot:NODE_1871_length_1046_cov_3.129388_g1522_i0.p1 GENE.NODE_1871_length_1046_cov_3.129388_g1522_i0~~NODE_1871_length_1046_cov_3.129388_g1522_i0.p1  ORF type:complete len:181 (+),score=37.97 NODE_1871_length_1046_cov_3.129388_g1522_i0:421-963(+)